VTAPEISGVPDADLGSLEFWGQPAHERDRYFEMLRRAAPISFHEPPEDILGLGDQGRLHCWAIVRYEDIRSISRDAATFCSGGLQFGDAPPEMLEASQSFWRLTLRVTPSCAVSFRRRSPPAR
jgi:cytochrome P450